MSDQWNNLELCNMLAKRNSETCTPNAIDNADGDASGDTEMGKGNNNNNIDTPNTEMLLQPGSDIKPKVQIEQVETLVRRLYGITISDIKELISYDDRNYLVHEDRNVRNPLIANPWPHGYVLKILNALDSKKTDFVDAQNELMLYLSSQNIRCCRPVLNVHGKYLSVEAINDAEHVVRLLEYIPDRIFHEVPKSDFLFYNSGEYLAHLDKALMNFQHVAYETHKTSWMLQSVPKLRDFIYVITDVKRKQMVEDIIATFEREVLSQLHTFDEQIIYGDYNEQNILVGACNEDTQDYSVTGIIDFGDTNKSPLIFEVSIALAYMMLQAKTLTSGGIFLAGYQSVLPLKPAELSYIKYCVAARLAQSLVMGMYTNSLDPSNEYVLVTQAQGWKMIEELWCTKLEAIDGIWQTVGEAYLAQLNQEKQQ